MIREAAQVPVVLCARGEQRFGRQRTRSPVLLGVGPWAGRRGEGVCADGRCGWHRGSGQRDGTAGRIWGIWAKGGTRRGIWTGSGHIRSGGFSEFVHGRLGARGREALRRKGARREVARKGSAQQGSRDRVLLASERRMAYAAPGSRAHGRM